MEERLSQRGWRRLLRKVRRRTADEATAEDSLQDAFVRLIERRGEGREPESEGLLVRIAQNLAIDEHRRVRRRPAVGDFGRFEARFQDDYPLQDEVLVAQERLRQVRGALAALPERTRRIFLMHRVEGMKYREIAADLGITVSAVEKHIARAAFAISGQADR